MILLKIIALALLPLLVLAEKSDNKVQNFINNRLSGEVYSGDVKCATRYQIHQYQSDKLIQTGFNVTAKIIAPQDTSRQRSMISPGGHFRISWDESGRHAVPAEDISNNGIPDYIDSAFVIFDHVWDVQIGEMNYPAPPAIDGTPVQVYPVYFSNLPYYGLTWFDKEIPALPGENYTSYMEVHNNFDGFYSSGLAGLKVTAAHEFHHAIQMRYNVRSADFFFYEMTSTWMENKIYPDINDYYQYLNPFFNQVSNTSFDLYNSSTFFPYGNAIYLQMVESQFGEDVVREIWEKFPAVNNGMDAIRETLAQNPYQTSWKQSLNQYGLWLYYTGDRAVSGQYFKDAADFPQIRVPETDKVVFSGEFNESRNINRLASRYIELYDVLNTDLMTYVSGPSTSGGGFRWITLSDESGFLELNKAYNLPSLSAAKVVFLITNASESDNPYTLSMSQPVLEEIAISQNPVIASDGNQEVQFKVPQNSEIYIYTISGRLVARLNRDVSQIRSWNLKNQQGEPVASGVYLWFVKSENTEKLNKFSIIR